MSYRGWKPYVSVAEKKQQTAREIAKLQKRGQSIAPITITGRKITNSFWGSAWCENLERYSDYASRLPRGRSYVRNGSVIDLQISKGKVAATVSGSHLYTVEINIKPVARARWQAICEDCSGAIDSLVELLQGRLAQGVMNRVCRKNDGLFPAPNEIQLSCNCPDWADMCKHIAAALYGVGARLDHNPELLFLLRGVDEHDLISNASETLAQPTTPFVASNILTNDDMAALFGLDMAASAAPEKPAAPPKFPTRKKTAKTAKQPASIATAPKPARKNSAAKAATTPAKTSKPRTAPGKPPRASAKTTNKTDAKSAPARKTAAKATSKILTGKKRQQPLSE